MSARRHDRRYCWQMIAMVLILGAGQPTIAQLPLQLGARFPKAPARYDWYVDTVQHQLWQWKDQWVLREAVADSVVPCHTFLVLKNQNGLQMYDRTGLPVSQSPIIDCVCADSISVLYTGRKSTANNTVKIGPYMIIFFNHSGRPLFHFENYGNYVSQVSWKGQVAWCMPDYDPSKSNRLIWRTDLHNWGIFGGNGRWVISPIYDKPFKFENGIAEVEYYGKRLKINEKGEVVD